MYGPDRTLTPRARDMTNAEGFRKLIVVERERTRRSILVNWVRSSTAWRTYKTSQLVCRAEVRPARDQSSHPAATGRQRCRGGRRGERRSSPRSSQQIPPPSTWIFSLTARKSIRDRSTMSSSPWFSVLLGDRCDFRLPSESAGDDDSEPRPAVLDRRHLCCHGILGFTWTIFR